MKNTYETPEVEIIKFALTDIIRTSGEIEPVDPDQGSPFD